MTTPRRPSMADRTRSTPLFVNLPSTPAYGGRKLPPSALGLQILTPPSSPRHTRSSSNLSNQTDDSLSDASPSCGRARKVSYAEESKQNEDGTLICPFDVELLKDHRGQKQTFGCGAWSTVFRGTCLSKSRSGLLTPPLSLTRSPPLLVAVKQPARKDARTVLRNEAKILSELMEEVDNECYIIPFYGIVVSSSSLVLEAVPVSLEDHIKRSRILAQASRTTWNMTDPVVGNTDIWLDLAHKLISALSWLHNKALVVHGDIKPGNILLNKDMLDNSMDGADEESSFSYRPLFADFSSSQRLDGGITPNTLSAVTREYTAPELLSSKVLSNPNSTATTDSDVFSLAVTLLVAATGNTMVYSGSVFQRQAMATQGWMVLQAARNGPLEEGARIPRHGVVERVLDKAVLRQGMGRIDATSWVAQVEDIMTGETKKL